MVRARQNNPVIFGVRGDFKIERRDIGRDGDAIKIGDHWRAGSVGWSGLGPLRTPVAIDGKAPEAENNRK